MPVIGVSIITGFPMEKKKLLIKELTDATAKTLAIPADKVRVVIYEVPREHFGVAGVPVSDIPGR